MYEQNWKLHDDLYLNSNVLDPVDFDGIILACSCDGAVMTNAKTKEERNAAITAVFNELMRDRMREAKEMFKHNIDEIYKEVFDNEPVLETKENMPLTPEQRENLAKDIYQILLENDMWMDVTIYYNGKAMSTSDSKGEKFRYGGEPFLYEADPSVCFDYVREPNILSMSFEGSLYEDINYGEGKVEKKLQDEMSKYGLYYELGDAWNLTCHKA